MDSGAKGRARSSEVISNESEWKKKVSRVSLLSLYKKIAAEVPEEVLGEEPFIEASEWRHQS